MMPHFQAFLVAAAFGILGGALYEPFSLLGKIVGRRPFRVAFDLIFCALFALMFVGFSLWGFRRFGGISFSGFALDFSCI